MLKVDSEEGPTYPYGINGCWPVANKVEVTEMEITITTPIPGECIVIIIEFVYFFFGTLQPGLHAAPILFMYLIPFCLLVCNVFAFNLHHENISFLLREDC